MTWFLSWPFHSLWLVPTILLLEQFLGLWIWIWHIPHPVSFLGRMIGALDQRFNRNALHPFIQFCSGVLVTILVTGGSILLGFFIQLTASHLFFGWALCGLAALPFFAQISLYRHVKATADALKTGGVAAGRIAVSHIVGRETKNLDEAGVSRAAIESCAESFCDAVVAPAFWFAVLGLPGLFAYKAINTMDSMIGYRNIRYEYFGKAAARLDDVMNYIPARLSALFLLTATLIDKRFSATRGYKVLRQDARLHASPNAGWPEASVAGILNLRLGGPRSYDAASGKSAAAEWIGSEGGDATRSDIKNMLKLYRAACGVHILFWIVKILILSLLS